MHAIVQLIKFPDSQKTFCEWSFATLNPFPCACEYINFSPGLGKQESCNCVQEESWIYIITRMIVVCMREKENLSVNKKLEENKTSHFMRVCCISSDML